MVKIEENILHELVAGNLHGEQYRRVLKAIDSHPDGWKDCALAFLHEQALTRELKALATDDEIWNESRHSDTVNHTPQHRTRSSQAVAPASTSSQLGRLNLLSRITSIAALLLVSFTVGWFGAGLSTNGWSGSGRGETQRRAQTDSGLAGSSLAGSNLAGNANRNRASLHPNDGQVRPDGMVALDSSPRPYSGESHLVSDGNLNGNFVIGESQMPFSSTPAILQELQRRGVIDFETQGGFVPVYDGESVGIVPVQQYRVKRKNFSF